MNVFRYLLPIAALSVLFVPPQDARATTIRPVMYGPWGVLCLSRQQYALSLTCTIRYSTAELDVQWEVDLGRDSARVVTWGLNKATCRPAQVSEAVDRNYSMWRPDLEASEVEEFARRTLEVMRLHVDFFGDCHNHLLRLYTPISPGVLDAAEPDFVRAFVASEAQVHQFVLRADAERTQQQTSTEPEF